MKVFRKITPGRQPRHRDPRGAHRGRLGARRRALRLARGSTTRRTDVLHLAMLQQFLRTATDGWDLALASVRNLFAEADLHADEVGGDFAGESARLGEALREVHETLREHFPAETRPAAAAAELAASMTGRLDAALRDRARAGGARRAAAGGVTTPLADARRAWTSSGSTATCTSARPCAPSHGWKIVDFEGEPAKPLAERQLPDSPWRDVAGMLRSFDYAARVVAAHRSSDQRRDVDAELIDTRAEEWAERNKNHFLYAYAGGELSLEQQVLLGGLRRRQGRLRVRLRDPQPPVLGRRSRSRPWPGSEQHDPPSKGQAAHASSPSPSTSSTCSSAASTAARTSSSARTRTTAASPSGCSSRWPRGSRSGTATAPTYELTHEHEGIWVGVLPGDRRARLPPRGDLRRRHHARGRRPLPVPAHARRDRPAPDQRGPPRAAVGRCSARGCTTTRRRSATRSPARRSRSGRRARARSGSRRDFNSWDGREHPMRQLGQSGRLGAVRARRRLRHGLQVRRPRRRRPVAREGRPDGVLRRGAAGHRVAGLRVVATSGATTPGWTRGREAARRTSRCRSTRCTSARGGTRRRDLAYDELADELSRLRRRPRASPTSS